MPPVAFDALRMGLSAHEVPAMVHATVTKADATHSPVAGELIQSLDERESGGTWIVRGKLDEEKRLQLLRKGVRCYQFDSRSW